MIRFKSLSFALVFINVFMAISSSVIAQAQDNFNFNVLNGLFVPTQSQRFFQTGREKFEQEIQIFTDPKHYLGEDLLQIDPKLIKQMKQPQPLPHFRLNNLQDNRGYSNP